MKFIMVIIICFGADCEALFEKTHTYDSYQVCYQEAIENANLLRQMFPASAGEVHCWDEEKFERFEKALENGLNPTIDPDLIQSQEPEKLGIEA